MFLLFGFLASVLKEIEIEGNILFSGNLPETMPTGSCLIITVESLLSTCDQGKGCTPRANATKIIKDVKITDDKLGYEVEINPNTLPDSYSIVVIFNVGWCSLRDKQQPPRTRPGDFQNAYVHEVHVDKHKEEYMKNILVTQVPLVYKGKIILIILHVIFIITLYRNMTFLPSPAELCTFIGFPLAPVVKSIGIEA